MPYFHAIAVFEARGSSLEETDQNVATLFKSLHHPRVLYYEHDTSGGTGPYPPGKSLYFSVLADFDVTAPNEEKAGELADEVFDALSTEEIQYIALGLTAGEQRVHPEQRSSQQEERASARETRGAQEGRGQRGGRSRGARGRGKKRGGERETESLREEESKDQQLPAPAEEAGEPPREADVSLPQGLETESAAAQGPSLEQEVVPPTLQTGEPETPLPPPVRSSPSMRVTLAISLRASELPPPTNGSAVRDQQELIALATAEARRRHPELPGDIVPESEVVVQPWGDTVLTLTWHYDVPVPSAVETA